MGALDAPLARMQLPEKLAELFRPRRYKVMHGGRGGGKSWAVVSALLALAADRPLRVLCAREVQKSMRDSVHRLLKDTIVRLKLEAFYEVLDTEIRGANGSLFLFSGLQSHTVDSIKSFEGVDIVWVEEAHCVSKRSWDVLIPTIRKDGSEIWMTLNPDMDTDETYQRFIATPSDDTWVCEINWRDNPWFPETLNQERLKSKRSQSTVDYEHVWEGKPRTVAEGAIYQHEIQALYTESRVANVPYDPTLPVHTVWDLGWNDAMTIGFVQRGPMDVRILDYIEDSHRTLDWYVEQIEKRPYRWGHDYLPHDGRTRNYQTGKSTEEQLQAMGRKPIVLAQTSVEEGIKAVRMMFPRCYFDKAKTVRLLECLKRYRRALHAQTNEPMAPLHDEFSHGCLDGGTMVLTRNGDVQIQDICIGDEVWTPAGYAKVLNSGPTKMATDLIEITMIDGSVVMATPEHKFFTTKGVVVADTLSYADSIFTKESSPCVSYQSIKSVGYRDAVIESFKEKGIGFGRQEESMARRLAGKLDCFILRFTRQFMGVLAFAQSRIRPMGILPIPAPRIGLLSSQCATGSMQSKSSMEFASTGSQKATTRQIKTIMAGSLCTVMFGNSTTDQYQADSISITKTKTRRTTILKTLKACLHQSIQFITRIRMNGLEAMPTRLKSLRPGCLQKSGTPAMQERNGIQKMPLRYGTAESGTKFRASNAGLSSLPRTQQGQSIAMPIAKLRRLDGAEAKRLVYDLTVEKHHCYLANGLLVSNCDMFRYVGQAVPVMPNVMQVQYEEPPPADWRM